MERENVRHTRKMAKLMPYRHTRSQLMDSIFGHRYVNQANPQKQNTHPLPMDIGHLISDYVGVRKNVTLRGGKRNRSRRK